MKYGIFIGICLFLIILQTTILPYFSVFSGIYDLLIPFVILMCIYLPLRESLPFVLILGLIMDNLSGSPFGLYLTFYFWLLVGVRWIITFLRVGNKFLLSLVAVVAVLVQNILIIATFALSGSGWQLPADVLKNIALQFFWAMATIPLFLFCLLTLLKRFRIQLNGASTQLQDYG
jgi:cell shape-determining protein MreD